MLGCLLGAGTVLRLKRDAWSMVNGLKTSNQRVRPPVPFTVGECEIYKEERGVLEEMRKLDECDMEEFGRLEISEEMIAILGDRWWPQSAKKDGDRISKQLLCDIWTKA